MLNMYLDVDNSEELPLPIIHDVEMAFHKIKITGTEIERKFIELIEQGSYLDSQRFTDRFGTALLYSELSTGCKAALVVLHNPDKIVDLVECGDNARDIIISLCSTGNILLEDNCLGYIDYADKICVHLDDYVFTTVDRLNTYVQEERPFPAFIEEGVERYVS